MSRSRRSKATSFAVAVLAAAMLPLAACSSDATAPAGSAGSGGSDGSAAAGERLSVVAAFYPLAWLAERIGGDLVSVRDLTPAGAEPHDLELDAEGVDAIDAADVALVMGRGFQPAVESAAGRRAGATIVVLDTVLDERGEVAEEGTSGGVDPHVWLDPVLMAGLVPAVQDALVAADPAHRDELAAAGARLSAELRALDADMASGLAACAGKVLVTSHEAFGRLAARYGLRQEGIAGLSPDAEPDPRRLVELSDLVEREGVTTVFTEELLPPELAETLARETGAATAVLSTLERLTDEQRSAGKDYLGVMRDDLATLRSGLGC